MLPIDSYTAEEAKVVEMEIWKLAAEEVIFSRSERAPIAEGVFDGSYLLVTAGDDRVTIYKGSPSMRRQAIEDVKAFGEAFDKRDYIQQVDITIAEARTVLKGLLQVVSILDVLADAA